jgi:glycine cleavage system H protein
MGEFLEATYDKFVFKVKDGCLYNRDDFWARIEGSVATVGITDYLQKIKGDVAFLEMVEPGAEVRQGQEIGKVETIKATFGIISPVTGRVAEVNTELEASPHLINQDPYGEGWVYRIELSDLAGDKGELLQSGDYLDLMKEKITKEMKK